MKRPRREAGGGEIALMAVITKAMGAFLVLVVIMLPHYSYTLIQNRTAEAAQSQIDQALGKANEISDQLKKGRLTDEEIDKLLKDIEDIKKQLAGLQTLVAALKNELDQARAEIARLTESNKRLEIEVAALKAEIEELKKHLGGSSTTAVVSWSSCVGAAVEIYVWSDGTGTNGERQPLADRTSQGPFWGGESVSPPLSPSASSAGHLVWRLPERSGTVFIWAKLTNPIYQTTNLRFRRCLLTATLETSRDIHGAGQARLVGRASFGDDTPIVLVLAADRLQGGGFQTHPLTDSERGNLQGAALGEKCEGMLCSYTSISSFNEKAAQAKPRFLAFVKKNYVVTEETAALIFDLVTAGKLSVGDGYSWLGIFAKPETAPSGNSQDRIEFVTDQFKRKGAPAKLSTEALSLLRAGRIDIDTVTYALGGLLPRPTPLDDSPSEPAANTPPQTPQQQRVTLFRKAIEEARSAQSDGRLKGDWVSPLEGLLAKGGTNGAPVFIKDIDERLARAELPDELSELISSLMLGGFMSLADFEKIASDVGKTSPPAPPR